MTIQPTPEQASILQRTLEAHTACFNTVAHAGFTKQCSNGVELPKQTSYPWRAASPDLPAQLVGAARVQATAAVRSALTWQQKHEKADPQSVAQAQKKGKPIPVFKPVKCPHAMCCPIRYDVRSSWVKGKSATGSLATVARRMPLNFSVPTSAHKYGGGKPCSAALCYRQGHWLLQVVVSIPEGAIPPAQEVVGVDLGRSRPAVPSQRYFLGEKRGKEQERRSFRLRRKLQKI